MKTYEVEKNARLIYRLMGLGMAGAVLHIGAHPDDEDVGLPAYLSCKFGVRTVYWSATRGEGGQNRIGPYRDEALGIYRTWESLNAREEDGGECLFGPFYDFGYSKNAEESHSKWGREVLVRELVRAIRLVQPHVIVARWAGTPGDFHGHHQAVGQAALEAFEAAGDPSRFTELKAQGLAAWQPLKYYHSTDNSGGDLKSGGALNIFGRRNPAFEERKFLRINTGEFDPIAGRTYQERAWLAYNKHQTQAMGLAPVPGDFFYYFSLHESLVPVPEQETSIFDGLDPSLTGLADHPGNNSPFLRANLEAITASTEKALGDFRAKDPRKAATSLLDALSSIRETRAGLSGSDLNSEDRESVNLYLTRKIADFEEVIAICLGLELECLSERARIIPGEQFRVSARLWNQRNVRLDEMAFALNLPQGWESRSLEPGEEEEAPTEKAPTRNFEVVAGEMADFTCPYWLVKPREAYVYNWPEGEPSGRPFGPPEVSVDCEIMFGDHRITLRREAVCREAFPGGFRHRALAVIPPISLHPKKRSQQTSKEFLPRRDEEQLLDLQVVARNNSDQAVEGVLELVVPSGWEVTPGSMDLSFTGPGETITAEHQVTVPAMAPAGRYPLEYRIRCGGRDHAVVVTPVRMGAPGLPSSVDESTCVKEEFVLAPSEVMVHLIDVKSAPGPRYAYVQGAEEELRDALKPVGVGFRMIEDAEMGYVDLSAFDAVVVGPNAYLIRDELRKYASRFLEYVKDGGTLIVQYQGYRYQTPGFAPYPFQYTQPHDRVTHEDSPVTILEPDHVLFRLPNPIRAADFDGWVRDRGLYFFGERDKRYRSLLSCSDPGEEPQTGGLVECQHGKGTFLYTGYTFFRQLPAGVPGAFRLFCNILALPEARILERIEFLKKINLFSLLTTEQLDALARIMSERWVEDGGYICRQGEVGKEMFVVYTGEVEVVRESGDRKEVIDLSFAGDSLGEMAVLGDIPRTASLRAKGDVQLLVITGPHFISLLREHPDASIQVIKLLLKRLAGSGRE